MSKPRLLFFAGGECLTRHGVLVRRTSIDEDVAETFTRTGTARLVDPSGKLISAAANTPRVSYPLVDGVRTPALLLSTSRANLIGSDDFTTWSDQNTCAVTASVSDPAGGTGAHTLTGDGGAAAEARYVTPTFTGDGAKSALFVVKESSMPVSGAQRLSIYDNTAAAFVLNLEITSWVDGEPQITAETGTLFGKQQIDDGWWIVAGGSTTVTAANTNRVYVYSNSAASAGAISVYRVNVFNASVPPPMPLDASGSVGTETFDVPIGFGPQECTIYLALKDIGMARNATAFSGDVMTIGRQSSGNGFIQVDDGGGSGDFRFITVGSGGGQASSYLPSGAVGFSDKVEMSCVIDSAFAPTLSYSVAGGAIATAASATNADGLPSVWAANYIRLHSEEILSIKVASGSYSLADMRSA